MQDNLPGCPHSKKPKHEEQSPTMVNLANIVFDDTSEEDLIFKHHLPAELDPKMSQIPVVFHPTHRYNRNLTNTLHIKAR
jgi:hypothetical protein